MMKKIAPAILFALALAAGKASAEEATGAAASESKTGFSSSGYVFWENFRLWEANYAGTIHKGDWFNSILGGFVLENQMSERLKTRVALEAKIYRAFPEVDNDASSRVTKPAAYIHEAKAVYSFGDVEAPPVQVEVGYFLYDYNKEQHNLGEYLFRSDIYPSIIQTNFELPMARLLGFRIGNNPFQGFHHDLLLTSEYQYYPKSSFSLSYLADYNLGGVFKLGAGVSFHHYLAVRPALETPTSDLNTYVEIPEQDFAVDGVGRHVAANKGMVATVQAADTNYTVVNPNTGTRQFAPNLQMTRTNFSYKGIMLMGQASFDPKPLFGSPRIFGPEDLKLYGEAAVLGLKDYPVFYQKIQERIPVMGGFNIPCFNLLDVLGVEVEYFASKYPENWERSLINGLPQPGDKSFSGKSDWGTRVFSKDDWKWSVYMRKHISKGLFVTAQAASDHLRLPDKDGNDYETIMRDTGKPFTGQWWGILRVTASY